MIVDILKLNKYWINFEKICIERHYLLHKRYGQYLNSNVTFAMDKLLRSNLVVHAITNYL